MSSATIAFDAAAFRNFGATLTWTHVCGANATVLFVYVRDDGAAVSGITYGGVAMTRMPSTPLAITGGSYYVYFLISPPTGSNTVSVAGSTNIGGASASYTGTGTIVPDAVATTSGTGLSSISVNDTSLIDNCWFLLCVGDRSGVNPTPGNMTSRATPGGSASMTLFDSNGPLATAGLLTGTAVVSGTAGAILISFGPPANTAIVTYGGGVITTLIRLAGLRIEDDVNQPTTCSFRLDNGSPQVGVEIKIGLGAVTGAYLIFAGVITQVSQVYEGKKTNVAYDITCQDYTYLLNRRRPIKAYTLQSVTAIAQDLITSFSSGFTSTNVQASLASVAVAFDGNQDFASCLTQLATLIGGYWYIDTAKDLHLFTAESTSSPDALTGNGRWLMLDPPITLESDLSQAVTRAYVMGAGSQCVAQLPVGATLIPLDSTGVFSTSGGSAFTGAQKLAYTGVTAGAAIAAPVGSWSLTPQFGGAGSLPDSTSFSYKIAYLTPAGESLPSAASGNATTGVHAGNNDINAVFTPTAGSVPSNIIGFKIFASDSTSAGAGPWHLSDLSTAGNVSLFAQLAAGGFAKDHQVVNNASAQPVTASTAGSDELMGSTTSGSTAIGATSVTVSEIGHFSSAGGTARVTVNGNTFVIKYTGRSANYGAGNLTGVPASDFGSVLFTIATGTAIQNVPTLTGVTGVIYPILAGDAVNLFVQRDDATAQTAAAALEGGDGIHEHLIRDSNLLTDAACVTRGDAELTLFKSALQTIHYATRDMKTHSGKTLTVSLPSPQSISGTFKITRVTIDQVDQCGGRLGPRYTVEASTTRFTLEDLLRQLKKAA